jgi:hypothetical protein
LASLAIVVVGVGLVAALSSGCSKKATPEQCAGAWGHVQDLLQVSVSDEFQSVASKTGMEGMPPDMAQEMTAQLRAMYDKAPQDPNLAAIKARAEAEMNEACQAGPETTAKCVQAARSVDELMKSCKMRPALGARGAMSLSWPD